MRAIDHLVLSFDDLVTVRERLGALGFTVAPDAVHPFGTGNACVFLADGVYLEPLAVVDAAAQAEALAAGNVFVARDAAFRAEHDLPGFSGLAFRSADALGDREALTAQDLAEPATVDFSRTFRQGDGAEATLSFRLAFARLLPGFAASLFFCEARHSVTPDRSALARHANGAKGLERIVVVGTVDEETRRLLETIAGSTLTSDGSGGATLALANVDLEFLTPSLAQARYGVAAVDDRLRLAGMVLSVADIEQARAALAPDVITERPERIVATLGPASTPFIAFEERPS